jgi:hypothetical protein
MQHDCQHPISFPTPTLTNPLPTPWEECHQTCPEQSRQSDVIEEDPAFPQLLSIDAWHLRDTDDRPQREEYDQTYHGQSHRSDVAEEDPAFPRLLSIDDWHLRGTESQTPWNEYDRMHYGQGRQSDVVEEGPVFQTPLSIDNCHHQGTDSLACSETSSRRESLLWPARQKLDLSYPQYSGHAVHPDKDTAIFRKWPLKTTSRKCGGRLRPLCPRELRCETSLPRPMPTTRLIVAPEDWERYWPLFEQLYIAKHMKIKDFMQIMKAKFGFRAVYVNPSRSTSIAKAPHKLDSRLC